MDNTNYEEVLRRRQERRRREKLRRKRKVMMIYMLMFSVALIAGGSAFALWKYRLNHENNQEKILSSSESSAFDESQDAVAAVVIATILMLLYIWFRFKDIRFATSAILALVHDVLVVLTFYAVAKWSVGSTFIACMLTIVGYSINATIVIFDRIRENLKEMRNKEELQDLVNRSISQTLSRSIFTSLTTFFMVAALEVFGVSSIREFALPLIAGIICGTYSSICLTGALWYVLRTKVGQKAAKTAK